jgi:hypothetical protein
VLNTNNLDPPPNNMSCYSPLKWTFGLKFGKKLKSIKINDLSGPIQFDIKKGLRENLTFTINENIKNELKFVGYWKENKNRTIEIVKVLRKDEKSTYKINKKLIVTTKLVKGIKLIYK